MSRVKLISDEEAPRLLQRIFGQMEQAYGAVPNTARALALVPYLVPNVAGLSKVEGPEGELPRPLKWLAKLRVAHRNACAFCIDIGHARAPDVGLTTEQLGVMGDMEVTKHDLWSEEERAVLAYTDALVTTMTISDELFARTRKHFSEPQIVELTAQIAAETFYNIINRALGIEAQGFGSLIPKHREEVEHGEKTVDSSPRGSH